MGLIATDPPVESLRYLTPPVLVQWYSCPLPSFTPMSLAPHGLGAQELAGTLLQSIQPSALRRSRERGREVEKNGGENSEGQG